ncbi:porin family protein [Flavicella sediminum]|uniref:outer membrane beta-barrel protein n=1 Tax=Flavicella sediminum TaxID=2585141 RepID=UPI00112113CA|nr:outer membrane beta-barrel protein [Flavicella sediminum]
MKIKHLIIGVFAICSSFTYGQEKGQISAFAGFNYYNSEGEGSGGFTIGGEYLFTDNISGALSYTGHSVEGGDLSEIGIDGRYYFVTEETINWFAVAGLRRVNVSTPFVSGSMIGFSIGAGGLYGINDNLSVIAQVKYSTASKDGIESNGTNILAGVQYSFN